MPIVVQDIILAARDQHPSFTRDRHSNRACITYLSQRHRVYYKELADELRDRLSTSRSIAAVIAGDLVGVDAAGTLYVTPSGADGHAVAVGADNVPYLLDPVISTDPFNDGFVLPADSLEIIAIWATIATALQRVPVRWLPQSKNTLAAQGDGLVATVNGWRLKPLRNPEAIQSLWDSVTSVTVAYVPEPAEFDEVRVETLAQQIAIPTIYGHVLMWELAAFLARREAATESNFPVSLLRLFTQQVTDELARAKAGAIMDHRVIKVHRTSRNR